MNNRWRSKRGKKRRNDEILLFDYYWVVAGEITTIGHGYHL